MNYIILLSLIVGLLTRVVDDYYDKKWKIKQPIIILFAFLYGFLIAIIVKEVPVLVSLSLAVIAWLIVAGKIDYYGHWIGAATFFVSLYLLGFSSFSMFDFILFLIFLFVGILDEIVSDIYERGEKFIYRILAHRPLLEITAFLISVFTGIWEIWLVLFLYDIGAGYVPVYKIFTRKFNLSIKIL